MPVTHEQVQQEFDPHYFVDYAVFSGALRNFVMNAMEAEFKNHPNDYTRRLFIVGLYQAEYSAYEDMGAMLHGLIRFQNGDHKTPLKGVLEHSPGHIVLDKLFTRYSIATPDDLYKALRLDKFIPADWPYTSINLEKVLRTMCRFMVDECRKNQQGYGVDAYNRIKHNLAFVPNGKRYLNQAPNSPAVLIPNPTPSADYPYALLGIPMDDKVLEARCAALSAVDATLRALAALYVMSHHAEFLRTARQIDPPSKLLDVPPLLSVLKFMQHLSDRADAPV